MGTSEQVKYEIRVSTGAEIGTPGRYALYITYTQYDTDGEIDYTDGAWWTSRQVDGESGIDQALRTEAVDHLRDWIDSRGMEIVEWDHLGWEPGCQDEHGGWPIIRVVAR